jgi:hypothetical protein
MDPIYSMLLIATGEIMNGFSPMMKQVDILIASGHRLVLSLIPRKNTEDRIQ